MARRSIMTSDKRGATSPHPQITSWALLWAGDIFPDKSASKIVSNFLFRGGASAYGNRQPGHENASAHHPATSATVAALGKVARWNFFGNANHAGGSWGLRPRQYKTEIKPMGRAEIANRGGCPPRGPSTPSARDDARRIRPIQRGRDQTLGSDRARARHSAQSVMLADVKSTAAVPFAPSPW